jgi:hypothetical protein
MTQFTQHAFINGKFLGSFTRSWQRVHATLTQPYPHAIFCPKCAEVWARFPVEGTDKDFQVIHRECRKCGGSRNPFVPAGSIILTWNEAFAEVDNWSDGMLKWELSVWLQED